MASTIANGKFATTSGRLFPDEEEKFKPLPAMPLATAKPVRSIFDADEAAARQRSKDSGAFGGPNLNPSNSQGPTTRLLDRYDAMQGARMGTSTATSMPATALESDTGKALRMARRLKRQGFGGAANDLAKTAGATGLKEPVLKSEGYQAERDKQDGAATSAAMQYQAQLEEQNRLTNEFIRAQIEALRKNGTLSPVPTPR
jgi:hypothetical protein